MACEHYDYQRRPVLEPSGDGPLCRPASRLDTRNEVHYDTLGAHLVAAQDVMQHLPTTYATDGTPCVQGR